MLRRKATDAPIQSVMESLLLDHRMAHSIADMH
jgi:hypothetical protein